MTRAKLITRCVVTTLVYLAVGTMFALAIGVM
jgi:hypothetical protein